jgi:Mor family transcriptional regulator
MKKKMPPGRPAKRIRNKAIVRLARKFSVVSIAKKFRITKRRVYAILARGRR